MGLTLEVRNVEEVVGAFLKFPDEISNYVRPAMKEAMVLIATRASTTHRYTTRSAMLDRSIQTDVDQSGFTGRVFLDTGVATYGPYIHEGFKSWPPDRFLDEAAVFYQEDVASLLEDAVDAALTSVGL